MLDDVALFIQVVTANSFTQAAKQLDLPVPVVSRRINRLEKTLKTKLLHRTTRKLSLTEQGQRLYESSGAAINQLNEAVNQTLDNRCQPSGKLRITVAISTANRLILPHLAEFTKRYPLIQVQMVQNNSLIDLVDQGFDLALRGGELPQQANQIVRPLIHWHYTTCASPSYLEQHDTPLEPSDLLAHNCLTYDEVFSTKWEYHHERVEHIAVKGSIQMSSGLDLVHLAEQGLGIVYLPDFIVNPSIQQGRLQPLLQKFSNPKRYIYAVLPDNRYIPSKTRAFLDFYAEQLDQTECM